MPGYYLGPFMRQRTSWPAQSLVQWRNGTSGVFCGPSSASRLAGRILSDSCPYGLTERRGRKMGASSMIVSQKSHCWRFRLRSVRMPCSVAEGHNPAAVVSSCNAKSVTLLYCGQVGCDMREASTPIAMSPRGQVFGSPVAAKFRQYAPIALESARSRRP